MKRTTIAAAVGAWLLIAATAAFPHIGRLLGAQAAGVAFASLPVIIVMLGIARMQQVAGRAEQEQAAAVDAALATVRTPAFPGGKDCPAGCCPICGMHDPDRLERCWGHLDAHPSCAEWVGELPQLTREQWREQIHHFPGRTTEALPTMGGIRPSEMREILREMGNPSPPPTERQIDQFIIRKAHEQERGELAAYRTVVGNPDAMLPRCDCGQKILACPACYAPYCPSCSQRHVFDCGRKWEQQQREIEAARSILPFEAWTAQQVAAFQAECAAALPSRRTPKSKIMRMRDGEEQHG